MFYLDQYLENDNEFLLMTRQINSNSNWTFIAPNLPYSKGTLRRNKTKTVNQFQYPGTEKSPRTENCEPSRIFERESEESCNIYKVSSFFRN